MQLEYGGVSGAYPMYSDGIDVLCSQWEECTHHCDSRERLLHSSLVTLPSPFQSLYL